MLVRLMVERGQDECVVKLAGTSYKFKRNEHGHLVSEISDLLSIQWVENPRNTSFIPYLPPKIKATSEEEVPPVTHPVEPENGLADEVFDEVVPTFSEPSPPEPLPIHEQVGSESFAPHSGQIDETIENAGSLDMTPEVGAPKTEKVAEEE